MAMHIVVHIVLVIVFIQEASAGESSIAKPGCQEKCGNVNISYPFGIGTDCYFDWKIEIYCDYTFSPPKPFLLYSKLEVLNISVLEGTIQVMNPVLEDCTKKKSETLEVVFVYNPFTFSTTQNIFIAMGCNNLALIKSRKGSSIGGCMSFCSNTRRDTNSCFGIDCCQTIIPPSFWNVSTSLRTIDPVDDQNLCKYAFVVDKNWFENLTDIYSVQNMKQVPAVLDWGRARSCSNTSLCGNNTICANETNLCSCKQGYEGNPFLPDGCHDIDECALNKHNCPQNCNNTVGHYTCSCKQGFKAIGNYRCVIIEPDVEKAPIVLAIVTFTGLGVLLVLAATWWSCKVMKRRKIRKLREKNLERNGGLLLNQQVSSSEGN